MLRTALLRTSVGLTLMVLTACGQPTQVAAPNTPAAVSSPASGVSQPTASVPTPAASVPVTQLRIAMPTLGFNTLDPILSDPQTLPYMRLMYDPIIGADPITGELSQQLGVSEKWEVTPTSLTLHLRRGIKFQNGDELTADDVILTLQRAGTPESTTGYGDQIKKSIQDMTAPDPYTVVIKTPNGASFLLQYLISSAVSTDGYVVPKKYLQSKGLEYFRSHPIGSGPYQVVDYTYGYETTLAAVDQHWRSGTPKYKQVKFMVIPESSTISALLKRGDVDIAAVDFNTAAEFKKAGYNLVSKDQAAVLYLTFAGPHFPGTALNDIRVREALNVAIDRQTINNKLFAGAFKPVGEDMGSEAPDMGFDQTPWLFPFDPAKAKDLLQQYGKPVSFSFYVLPVTGLPVQQLAEAIAGYWSAVGVKVALAPTDKSGYSKILGDAWQKDTGDTNAVLGPGAPAVRSFVPWVALLDKSLRADSNDRGLHGGDRPTGHPGEHRFSPLIDEIQQIMGTGDMQRAKAKSRDLIALLRKDIPTIPLYMTPYQLVTRGDLKSWNTGVLVQDLNFEAVLTGK